MKQMNDGFLRCQPPKCAIMRRESYPFAESIVMKKKSSDDLQVFRRKPAEKKAKGGRSPAGTHAGGPRDFERFRERVKDQHNTKVVFRFKCARCEEEDELGYVPRTVEGALCHKCARIVLGTLWRGDSRHQTGHTFNCAGCGVEAWVKSPPEDDRLLLCEACLRGLHKSEPSRVGGKWLDPDGGVKKKAAKG